MFNVLRPITKTRKLLLSLALVGCTARMAGLGTFATFTSSTTPVSHIIATGSVSISVGATGAQTNRLNIDATGIVPGDTIQRSVDLSSASTNVALASITLTTDATTSSVLDTDTSNGLQMTIDKCPGVGWVESLSQPYAYTCAGTTSTVLASRPVIGANIALANLAAQTTAGSTDHLRVTLTLPSSADNTFQNKTSTIRYVFNSTQRAATDK